MIEAYAVHAPRTRCPLNGELTTIASRIYTDTVRVDYAEGIYMGGISMREASRCLGTILGCGHVLAGDTWQWRIASADGVYMGWWAHPNSKDFTIPDDAVPVKGEDDGTGA